MARFIQNDEENANTMSATPTLELSAPRLLVEPLRDLFFELRLDDAIQVSRIPDLNHRPILSGSLEWGDVKSLYRVMVSDDDDDRNTNPFEFRFSQSQFSEAAGAGRRRATALS